MKLLSEEYEKLSDKNTPSTHSWRMKMLETQNKITKLDKELNFGGVGTSLQTIKTYLNNAEQRLILRQVMLKYYKKN